MTTPTTISPAQVGRWLRPGAVAALAVALLTSGLGVSAGHNGASRLLSDRDHQVSACAQTGQDATGVATSAAAGRAASWHPAPARASGGRIIVDVFAHVLRTASRGGVPHSRILAQIRVLNSAFAGRQSPRAADSAFRFRLIHVDVTRNRRWYLMNEGSLAEQHAKRALHAGGSTDLNLYIGRNSAGVLGWGTQPTRLAGEPRLDGVVIARHTMPGGSGGRYSSGDAAVHETGHWLGLLHTFAGRCARPGDHVADTPAEGRPSYDCYVRRDTCTAPGNDPVHNFMDYSTDACMNQFTPGQAQRMLRSWQQLRDPGDAVSPIA